MYFPVILSLCIANFGVRLGLTGAPAVVWVAILVPLWRGLGIFKLFKNYDWTFMLVAYCPVFLFRNCITPIFPSDQLANQINFISQ